MNDLCPEGGEHLDFCFVEKDRKYIGCRKCSRVEYADGGTYFEPGDLDPDRFETTYQPKKNETL